MTLTLEPHPGSDPHGAEVAGVAPDGLRVDPDITEGYPSYQETW